MADDTEGGRKLRAKERKKYIDQDIDEDDIDGRRMYNVEDKLLSDRFSADMVQELKGPEFTMDWMQKNGLNRPVVFYEKTGLGLRVPSENFKVSDVKQCVGSRRVLDVMDVNTQKAMEMPMKDWVKYYENPERDRLLNVISLEFCHTRLENYVESPTLVRQIDWVDRAWPRHLKECQTESTNVIERMKYPKVQKYCLMSVAGCYTDFHIDFGGTSVWYHILHGEKIFWLAPPSPKNIDKYTEWTLSAKQGDTFLGDSLEQCQRIQLRAGYTFIIPSGWIHAVYTPKDSLVFGGNFLHSFNIENQLLVSRIEDKTYVPSKFRYPFFSEIMWYVLDRYISCLSGRTYLSSMERDEFEDDDQGLIQVDEDSRPPSRNPDSRPPSRAMDESMESKMKSESGEDAPKLSKSVTIELTRIDATLRRSQSEDENQPPLGKSRVPRKATSDPNSSWEGGGANRKWIHLTVMEMRGLRQLVDYLSGLMALPPNKRGVPRDMVDPEAALREVRQLLEDHKNDDQELAVSGEPSIGWPESAKKKQQKLKLGYKTFKASKSHKGSSGSSSSSIRRRRTRCKQCEACTRTECGECTFCKDMKKFGGPGRMKQTCISRQCMAPVLPSSSVCMICNQEGQPNPDDSDDVSMSLMECGICWEIVHPLCLQRKYENLDNEGAVNEDLPNSWECSKCCNDGKQGQLKPRTRPGISSKKIKTEDHRFSPDSDGSHEEEPISPISPVEGKRVVAKEGGGARNGVGDGPYVKSELGASKWPSPPKKLSSYSEVKVKTEDNVPSPLSSSLPSSAREENSRKRNQPVSGSGQKDIKRLVKKEKTSAPNSPSTPDELSRNPRKRLTPGSGEKNSQPMDPGGKRPKRENNSLNTEMKPPPPPPLKPTKIHGVISTLSTSKTRTSQSSIAHINISSSATTKKPVVNVTGTVEGSSYNESRAQLSYQTQTYVETRTQTKVNPQTVANTDVSSSSTQAESAVTTGKDSGLDGKRKSRFTRTRTKLLLTEDALGFSGSLLQSQADGRMKPPQTSEISTGSKECTRASREEGSAMIMNTITQPASPSGNLTKRNQFTAVTVQKSSHTSASVTSFISISSPSRANISNISMSSSSSPRLTTMYVSTSCVSSYKPNTVFSKSPMLPDSATIVVKSKPVTSSGPSSSLYSSRPTIFIVSKTRTVTNSQSASTDSKPGHPGTSSLEDTYHPILDDHPYCVLPAVFPNGESRKSKGEASANTRFSDN